MADLMPIFNSILKEREAPPAGKDNFSREKLDEFLKEAYLIVCDVLRPWIDAIL